MITKKIFIVDDDEFWFKMLNQILAQLGYTDVILFKNGTDCLHNMHLNPAIIFLDYEMEEINGLETLNQIKTIKPDAEVVFCTAHESLELALKAMQGGSIDYLLKTNISITELKRIFSHLKK